MVVLTKVYSLLRCLSLCRLFIFYGRLVSLLTAVLPAMALARSADYELNNVKARLCYVSVVQSTRMYNNIFGALEAGYH